MATKTPRFRFRIAIGTVVGIGLLGAAAAQPQREPVYVGSRACAACHRGPEMGNQFSKWLLTKHSRAYAVLSQPDAMEIARLSGVPQIPQESPVCLGCHSTGAEVEEWEREESFLVEDGIQCEKCHGPGSEYMDAQTMMDREAAMMAGLKMPTRDDCLVCHNEKGSHVAVHHRPKLDIDNALLAVAHPTPDNATYRNTPLPSGQADESVGGPKFIGVAACAECHRSAAMGFQYSIWRLSAHARSYARLSTPEARTIAQDMGITGNPQEALECLACHSTAGGRTETALPSFTIDEGVGCETCHGAGSDYQWEAVMMDPPAAVQAGLTKVTRETCDRCHAQAHGKPFDYEAGVRAIAHPKKRVTVAREVRYKNPINLAVTQDSTEVWIACESSDSVIVVDATKGERTAEIPVGGQPHDVTFSPDGRIAYVTNRLDDTLSEIDVASREVRRTIPVGDEPHAVITDREGSRLYVLNTGDESISVLERESLEEIRRLVTSRYPWSMALSPDGSQVFVTNSLPKFRPVRTPQISELTVIDSERAVVETRYDVADTNLLQGVAWHPSGDYALITLLRTKNLVPMTRLMQGWTITNGLGVVWRDGRVDQVLLDSPEIGFPDPTDVAITPDGKWAFVSSATLHRVAAVDLQELMAVIEESTEQERREVLPNHLGTSPRVVARMIDTGLSPRGLEVAPDGTRVFVANSLDDSITVIDVARLEATQKIDLGGPSFRTKTRWGEQLFHDAAIAFRRSFSCHSCHPDGHVDGITYDIEPDGIGVNPVDNRTLRGILDTAPFKWEGTNPSLQRQCGPRLAVFFTRVSPFTPDELSALDLYISTIERPPNRFRPLGAELTPAQRRGRALFDRTRTNGGRIIPNEGRCSFCHPPPLFTNRRSFNVGTQLELDTQGEFDVPHLTNIYDSAPYLHNGAAHTLEEIWTVYNPQDKHGVTNDMTKDQLNDLIEYIKTF